MTKTTVGLGSPHRVVAISRLGYPSLFPFQSQFLCWPERRPGHRAAPSPRVGAVAGVTRQLPDDGPLVLNLLTLPPGRRVRARQSVGSSISTEVMWITDHRLSSAGSIWWSLRDQTNLV